jgi:UDP-N-acetylmuramoyl-tripeptide--D-alanyl-D-alanine ligase
LKEKKAAVMTISEVLRATGGILTKGEPEKTFQGVSTDSRQLQEGNLFLCLRGENFDGHRFLAAAAAAGAAGFVIQKDAGETLIGMQENLPVILVEDTLQALGEIARFWRRKLNVPVIAVTGSSGNGVRDPGSYEKCPEDGGEFEQPGRLAADSVKACPPV